MSLQGIIASVLSGGIFAAGWFVLIDGYGIGTTIVHDAQSLSTQGCASRHQNLRAARDAIATDFTIPPPPSPALLPRPS